MAADLEFFYNRVLVACLSPTDVCAGRVIIIGFWSPVCRQQMFMQGLIIIILGFWSPVCRQQMFVQGLLLY